MSEINKNGTVYIGKKSAHQTILVKVSGYKYPVWSSVRSSGIAYVGTRYAGLDYEYRIVERPKQVEIPAGVGVGAMG